MPVAGTPSEAALGGKIEAEAVEARSKAGWQGKTKVEAAEDSSEALGRNWESGVAKG